MSDMHGGAVIRWWAAIVAGTAAALLIAWLGHVAGVPLRALLSIGAGAAALAWLIMLVAMPWNLYFAARGLVAELVVSRERGIDVRPGQDAEASRIARRMLWFALGGHVVTAAAAAVAAFLTRSQVGYYVAGAYLLSAAIRPAAAYFAHLRERISALSRESTHPRDDVITLRLKVDELAETVRALAVVFPQARGEVTDDLRRTETRLAGDISHARNLLTADLARIQDAQASDREASRSRDEDLGHRIDQMVRGIEGTLDGISDHREVQAGLRALVRMIRADPSGLT
jgi:hypothetical protein